MRIDGFGFGAERRRIGGKVAHQRKRPRVVRLGPAMAVIEPLVAGKIFSLRHPVRRPAAPIRAKIVDRPAVPDRDHRAGVRGRVEPAKPETLRSRERDEAMPEHVQSVDEIVGRVVVGDDRDAGGRPSGFGGGAGDDRCRDAARTAVADRRGWIVE